MRKIISTLMLLLTVVFLSFGQDVRPISPLFKNLPSPSFSFMIGGNPWIYKGSAFNPNPWTELAGWTNVKDTLANYWNKQEITIADTTRWGTGGTDISGKEDKSNKENTTVNNDTTKYPTVNLLKTYADTKLPTSNISGTSGYIPKFTGINALGNSPIYTDGSNIGIGTTNYVGKLSAQTSVTGTSAVYGIHETDIGAGYGGLFVAYTKPGAVYSIGAYLAATGAINNMALYLAETVAGDNNFAIYSETPAKSYFNGNVGIGYSTGTEITNNKLAVNGSGYFNTSLRANGLSGTGTRLITASNDGTLGTTDIPIFNYTVQSLSGTNVTWDLANGKDATITLTGNTVITLSNAINGMSGTLWVTNPSTVYTITFAGYVNSIDPFIRLNSNIVITSGGSKSDDYTYKYNGTKMNWNGTLDRH